MRSMLIFLLCSTMLAGCDKLVSKPASLDDITKVVDALRAAGCTGLKELDVESDEYEVGGVVCAEGKSYDVKLDKSFNIISKREDHL
jgi:Peptidase propeptide and YPEB domain